MSDNKQYSLYIKQNEVEESISNKENPSMSYIIFQNNELLRKYEEMASELNDAKKQIEELEEDIDKMQKSKTFLQGLAKNSYILKNHQVEIADYYKYTNTLTNYLILFINVCSIGQYMCFIFDINPILFLAIQLATTFIFVKQFVLLLPDNVKNAKIEFDTIQKATDHIMELIDES